MPPVPAPPAERPALGPRPAAAAAPVAPPAPPAASGTPLGGLLAHAAQARAAAGLPGTQQTLAQFRQLWGQLSTERQVRQSAASVPEGAGPLNSQRLVLRALQSMQQLSPAYLNRYMAYAETLLWLDEAGSALMPPPPPRPAAPPAPRPAAKADSPATTRPEPGADTPPRPAAKPARKPVRKAARKPAPKSAQLAASKKG
ncbi:DUF2894 domain-containing protein [Aquabacterium sp. OR-4]|uniref:DUF2894 domain-containing protein n=1 Tax=Aquabacterium sp. OR-4 TaxID=2978127 RepID=UPI0021B2881B|nr:DUF2894 domain-containing protein [Aquabacterium sp. OR-4]MDT7838019.1 DUF2894 domain-containing protein [Aquabacterium sp. OR-4]